MRASDRFFIGVVIGAYVFAAFQGRFVDLLLLWALPVLIGKIVMDWYVNYLPHFGLPADRFLGTRILDVPWLTPVLLKHNYHAIHHLWPSIPWHAYPETFRRRLAYLREHGVPIETRLIGGRLFPSPSPGAQRTPAKGAVGGRVQRQDA